MEQNILIDNTAILARIYFLAIGQGVCTGRSTTMLMGIEAYKHWIFFSLHTKHTNKPHHLSNSYLWVKASDIHQIFISSCSLRIHRIGMQIFEINIDGDQNEGEPSVMTSDVPLHYLLRAQRPKQFKVVFAVTSSGLLSWCTVWQTWKETRAWRRDCFDLISRDGYIR